MSRPFYIMTAEKKRMRMKFPGPEGLFTLNLDIDLNSATALEVILNGLIRGSPAVRRRILSKFPRFPNKPLLDEYLISSVMKTLKRDLNTEISEEYIFERITTFSSEIFEELPTRRTIKGDLANVAQALSLQPKLRHIGMTIKIIKKSHVRLKKAGHYNKLWTLLPK